MSAKKFIQFFTLAATLVALLALPSNALAGSSVCGGHVTVISGDTLRKIADRCGTTVNALTLANALGNANVIYVGQVLVMPGALLRGSGGYDIYIVNHGDTLKQIAANFGTTMDVLLSLNLGITNANLIYAGQRMNVPAPGNTVPTPTPTTPPTTSGQTYIVQRGDTMKIIANRLGITLETLTKANPQVNNINLIYVGQKLNIPDGISVYIVVKGDTLKKIADRFGTTWKNLQTLNPDIKNANLIYVGQVIKIK